MDIYTTAWKKGLKTTYYLHMKPRHTAEQSTVAINKREQLGKKGFGAVATEEPHKAASPFREVAHVPATRPDKKTVPVGATYEDLINADPQEKFICDSCQ